MRNEHLKSILLDEIDRQKFEHNFIASENFASREVMRYCGSEFMNKYSEGYPGKRYYNGCENYDKLEKYGIELLTKLYGCKFGNIQPHSGANANLSIFKAFLNPGDKILGMDLSSGGHLTHGSKVNFSGRWFESFFYGVDDEGWLDYDSIEDQAKDIKPKMIIAGASAYPRQIDFKRFREICDSVGAYLLVDMSHYSGLIASGVYSSPVDYADFITSTTHKTLRGARGGMILWNDEKYSKKINSSVFPGTQGGPLMNQIAGKVQSFYEALSNDFTTYTENVIKMSKFMCDIFRENDVKLTTDGTDSHMILIHTKSKSGKEVADILENQYGIVVNKNTVPNDSRGVWETSGIRIGTAAMVTKKGDDEDYFRNIADKIIQVI